MTAARAMPTLSLLDWTVVGVYFLGMLGVGWWFARRQRTTEEFFLAGRNIPVWAAAISIVGVSAATFIGGPEQSYSGNLTYLSANIAQFIGVVIVALVFVPAFFAARVSTVYELLDRRFGPGARQAASAAFMAGRLLASGARLFVAAIPLSLIIFGDLESGHLIVSIMIVAAIASAYTVLGGLDAVIWTDVAQTLLFIGAAVAAIFVLFHKIPTGTTEIITTLGQTALPDSTSKLTILDTRFSFASDFNIWSAIFGLTLFNIAVHATDQDLAQRLLTFKSAKRSGLSVFLSSFVGLAIALVFLVIGLLLYVYYQRPDLMHGIPGIASDDTRRVFLGFIFEESPAGIRGLILAGLFAGAMGAAASSMSAMGSTIVNDFYRPIFPDRTERHYVVISRWSVFGWGVLLAGVACLCVEWQATSGKQIIPFVMGVMLYAYTGLVAVFFCAIATRRGNSLSVVTALLTGAIVVALMQFGPIHLGVPPDATAPVRFSLGWQMLIGTVASFIVCILGRGSQRSGY